MNAERLEGQLAALLNRGTALASAVLAVGFLAALRWPLGAVIETAGVALFILLPVLRVALMLAGFGRGTRHEPLPARPIRVSESINTNASLPASTRRLARSIASCAIRV